MAKFSARGLRRVAEATVGFERRYKGGKPGLPSGGFIPAGMWFYTTASGGTASRTGTTSSNSVLTFGTVAALPCKCDPTTGAASPDTSAASVTLKCGVIPATSPTIATDKFVYAVPYNGQWLVIHVASCT